MAIKPKDSIEINTVSTNGITFCILGTQPFICNRMSEKVKMELLIPRGKKSSADKASSMKHDPLGEFRDSPYLSHNATDDTLLLVLSSMFKSALRSVAVDMPGAAKAQIGRLTSTGSFYAPLYGIPKVLMAAVRSAGMNATPDIRTRAIVPQWASRVQISWVEPLLDAQKIANLLSAAGIIQGVGDWRPGKGNGSFGQFRIVNETDAEFLDVVATGGRAAQAEAMQNPQPFDEETADLLSRFSAEVNRRGLRVA